MNNTEVERIARLEANYKNIHEDIQDIKDNHICGIYKRLEGMNKLLIGLLTTVIGVLILGIVNIIK